MRNKKIGRIKEIFAILLVFSFTLSVLAIPASAENNEDDYKDSYDKGYSDGIKQAQKDCKLYSSKETLTKIPSTSSGEKDSNSEDYERGFLAGYHANRFGCLK